jgi:CubicO group peptidase (beta-lactamase class C family)
MKKIATFTAFFLFPICLLAQTGISGKETTLPLREKIDAYLQSAYQAYKFNGVAIVVKQGEVLLHKAYGSKDVTTKAPIDTSTRFPILSITKSFTAIVLLQLQEQGRLSLQDPVNKYIPAFSAGQNITLEHLLTHTSGIFNYTDNISEKDTSLVGHPVTQQMVLDQFVNQPLAFKPGKGFSYNNSAYFLAGMVIEKVTGQPYEQAVRERVFAPLGMTNSGFDYLNLPSTLKATGYQYLNDTQQKPYPFYDSTVGYAAGSIYSTTSDLLKWVQTIGKGRLLSAASWKAALQRKAGNYGYGFQLDTYQGKNYIKHSGGYPGFASEFIYFPADDVIIILLCNVGNYGQDLWPITMGLSNLLFNVPYDLWQLRKEVQLPDAVLKEKEGKYSNGKYRITLFLKDSQLYTKLPSGLQLPLLAEGDDSFYLENYNTQLHFIKDEKAKVIKVVIHEHGQDHEWIKLR